MQYHHFVSLGLGSGLYLSFKGQNQLERFYTNQHTACHGNKDKQYYCKTRESVSLIQVSNYVQKKHTFLLFEHIIHNNRIMWPSKYKFYIFITLWVQYVYVFPFRIYRKRKCYISADICIFSKLVCHCYHSHWPTLIE